MLSVSYWQCDIWYNMCHKWVIQPASNYRRCEVWTALVYNCKSGWKESDCCYIVSRQYIYKLHYHPRMSQLSIFSWIIYFLLWIWPLNSPLSNIPYKNSQCNISFQLYQLLRPLMLQVRRCWCCYYMMWCDVMWCPQSSWQFLYCPLRQFLRYWRLWERESGREGDGK